MEYNILDSDKSIVYVTSDDILILNTQSALDLIASISYTTYCNNIILDKKCVCEDFFDLSTGTAGEILQKFINYNIRIAIVGDYSHYTSKHLHDFLYESNKGNHIFFTSSIEEAEVRLM